MSVHTSDAGGSVRFARQNCVSERVVLVCDITSLSPFFLRHPAFFSERSNVRDPFSFGSLASCTVGFAIAKGEIARATKEGIGRRTYIYIHTTASSNDGNCYVIERYAWYCILTYTYVYRVISEPRDRSCTDWSKSK